MSAPLELASDVPTAVRESLDSVNSEVLAGLDRVGKLGIGRGFLEAAAGVNSAAGLFGRLEVGARPAEHVALFGYGQVTAPLPGTPAGWGPTAEAGVGARVTW